MRRVNSAVASLPQRIAWQRGAGLFPGLDIQFVRRLLSTPLKIQMKESSAGKFGSRRSAVARREFASLDTACPPLRVTQTRRTCHQKQRAVLVSNKKLLAYRWGTRLPLRRSVSIAIDTCSTPTGQPLAFRPLNVKDALR